MRKELGEGASEILVKSKVFKGNRPSTSIMFPILTPATLGEYFFFFFAFLAFFGNLNFFYIIYRGFDCIVRT